MELKEDNFFVFNNIRLINFKYLIKNILYSFSYPLYKIVMNSIHPKVTKKKYKISSVSIFKNEAPYLKEWIEYNHLIGVEHFYLYNNNSNDNYQEILKPYIKSGLVTLIQWPKNQAQMECYQDGINNFKCDSQWLCFIDIDEFIVPLRDHNLYDFLKKFEKNRGSVLIYWKMFCTSGVLQRSKNGLVVEDFTVSWPKITDIGKCFYNTNYEVNFADIRNKGLHHSLWTTYKGINFPPVNCFDIPVLWGLHKAKKTNCPIQLNHYFTKSYFEYAEKKAKGDVYFSINPHDEEYFYKHEMLCTSSDYSIYKYLIKLKLILNIKNKNNRRTPCEKN